MNLGSFWDGNSESNPGPYAHGLDAQITEILGDW